MDVRFGRWVLKPYQSNGQRCWQLFRKTESGKVPTMPMCYPSTIGYAIEYAANYAARNDEGGTEDLKGALERYEAIIKDYREQALRDFGDGKVRE